MVTTTKRGQKKPAVQPTRWKTRNPASRGTPIEQARSKSELQAKKPAGPPTPKMSLAEFSKSSKIQGMIRKEYGKTKSTKPNLIQPRGSDRPLNPDRRIDKPGTSPKSKKAPGFSPPKKAPGLKRPKGKA